MLGLVIGGRPCRTDFTTVSPTSLTIDIPQPATATEVCLFVLPGAALPPGSGITVLGSPPPFTDWSPLCWVVRHRPRVVGGGHAVGAAPRRGAAVEAASGRENAARCELAVSWEVVSAPGGY